MFHNYTYIEKLKSNFMRTTTQIFLVSTKVN